MQDEDAMLQRAEKFMSDLQTKKICLDKNTSVEALMSHVNTIIDCKKTASPRSNRVINQLLQMSEKIQKNNTQPGSPTHEQEKEGAARTEKCDYSHSYKHNQGGEVESDNLWDIMSDTNIRYSDIKGCGEAISRISESIIIPMKYPIIFQKSHGRRSSGVLLFGPPGTGKSMIARATACEVSATFYTASCAELTSRWVGGSEKKLQSLFKTAVANSPSIVFLDEIDSIAGIRGQESTIADQRLTNQLLIELDEINTRQSPVFVMAATNLPWQIDDAVMRRLSRKIYIPMPTHEARLAIFEQAFQRNPEVTGQDLERFAHAAACLSGSDLATIISHVNFQPLHILYTCTRFAVVVQGGLVQSVSVFSEGSYAVPVVCGAVEDAPVDLVDVAERGDSDEPAEGDLVDVAERGDSDEPAEGEHVLCVECTFPEIVEKYGEEAVRLPPVDLAFVQSEIEAFAPTVSSESLAMYANYMQKRMR